jgi:hypothetical protein
VKIRSRVGKSNQWTGKGAAYRAPEAKEESKCLRESWK